MSSELQAPVKSFYLNIPTRPPISKRKVHKLGLKKWETSLEDFNENKKSLSFSSLKSNTLSKELNLCKRKIFFENAHKSLKRKSISEKNIIETDLLCLNNRPFRPSIQQKEKKININFNIQATFETVNWDSKPKLEQNAFSENAFKKRKSVFNQSTIDSDFLCLKDQSKPRCCSSSVRFPQKEKRALQNANYNLCNNKGERKTLNFKYDDIVLCDSNPEEHAMGEKVGDVLHDFNPKHQSIGEKVEDVLRDFNLKQHSIGEKVGDVLRDFNPKQHSISEKVDVLLEFNPKQHSIGEKDGDVKRPKHNFVIPEEFSCNNNVQVLSKNALTESFKTVESLKEEKHVTKIDLPEDVRNLFKTDAKCSSIGVGSEWIHSLEHILQNHSQGKKKIQNLIVGGYCEQILKFQRRELSEKAICEHTNGLKAERESVLMRINSIIHDCEIIITECCLLDQEELRKGDSSYIALFQKSSFNKQQMKTGKAFLLSLPWHFLQLKCFPVFICKYFKSVSLEEYQQKLSMDEKLRNNEMKFRNSALRKCNSLIDCENRGLLKAEQKEDMFLMWKKKFNLWARIQRTWNYRISVQKLALKDQYISRLTLLLQARNGEFYLLSTSSLCTDWFKFNLSNSEGNCYFFEGLNVLHRLERNRYPKLFQYLKHLLKENKVTKIEQDFVYQLGFDGMTKKPSKITEVDFHPFISIHFQSLLSVIKKSDGRVSCKAKVLLHYRSILYVCDESLLHSGNVQFVKVFLPHPPPLFPKSEVCITEALVFQSNLYVDEYSQISSHLSNEDISIQDVELPLRPDLNVADILTVKGNITNVDEKNAFIWLQCSFCGNENLIQNYEDVIFCEDCCRVVEHPFLKVKMNVTVSSESLQNILLNIELSSVTIKRILSLKENSYQPQCNVSDVLGKEIGPLLCYVKDTSPTIFYLIEVEDYH